MVRDHTQMVEMTRYDDVFIAQYGVGTFYQADYVLSCRIRVMGSVHFYSRPFSGSERGGFLRLFDAFHRFGVCLACPCKDVVGNRIGDIGVYEVGVVAVVGAGYPFIQHACGAVFNGVFYLVLVQGVRVPHQ